MVGDDNCVRGVASWRVRELQVLATNGRAVFLQALDGALATSSDETRDLPMACGEREGLRFVFETLASTIR